MDFENPIDFDLTEEQEKNIINEMQSFFDEAKSYRSPYEDKWLEYYILLRSYKEDLDSEDAWMSNLHIPIATTMVMTAVPMLTESFINPLKSFARVLPVNMGAEDAYKAEIAEKVVKAQFRNMKYGRTAVETITECATYGTAWQKLIWKKETKNLRRRVPRPTGEGEFASVVDMIERVPVTTFEGNWVEPIDLFYFYPDPKATNDDNLQRYVHPVYFYPKTLKKLVEAGYFFLDEDAMDNLNDDYSGEDKFKDERLGEVELGSTSQSMTKESRRLEVVEYYDNGHYWFILNRKKILRHEYEPFFHGSHNIGLFSFFKVPHELFGIGLIELVQAINQDADFLHNSRNDWITLMLKRPYFVDYSRLDDPEAALRVQPFGLIGVNPGEDINKIMQPMPVPDQSPSFYKDQELLHNMAQMVTGINDYIRGANGPSLNDTATGVSIITKQAMNRLLFHTQYIAATAIAPLVKKMIFMNNQFLSKEMIFNITDDQRVMAGPQDMPTEFDVIPVFDPGQATKDMERQAFVNGIQMIGGIMPMAQITNWRRVEQEIFKKFDIPAPDEYLIPEQVLMQQQMAAQQQQMMQQQMQQGGGAPGQPPPGPQGSGGPSPTQVGPPPAKPPPFGSEEDMVRMIARARIGNADKTFEV